MTTISYAQYDLQQVLQFLALALFTFAYACGLGIWKTLEGLWAIRRPIALVAAVLCGLAVCVTCTVLLVGLGLLAVFIYPTKPLAVRV